jgi:hypothetical protein
MAKLKHRNLKFVPVVVSALGIDLTVGALIGLGIQFGVGPEAIELAAVLSFPKTPYLMSNPLIHKPAQFNGECENRSLLFDMI